MRYRKKPVIVEAFKWTGGIDQIEDPLWANIKIQIGDIWFENVGLESCFMLIKTLEGVMKAQQGDYVICGIKGEVYPCKPDIFEATYEKVEEPL